jgi:hypothetical protein
MPRRPARPATVTAASVLLIVAAVLVLLPLVSVIYQLTHFDDVLRRAAERTGARPQEVDRERTFNQLTSWFTAGALMFISTALFVPTLWMRRGNPVARLLSSAAAGAATLCCCSAVGLAAASGQGSANRSVLQTEATRLAQQETPGWVGFTALLALLVPLFTIGALVLLLVPSSNRYFHPASGPDGPPYPYGGYHAYPTRPADGPDPHPPPPW